MSPENTHKLMGFYKEIIILGVNTMYMLFCFFKSTHHVDTSASYIYMHIVLWMCVSLVPRLSTPSLFMYDSVLMSWIHLYIVKGFLTFTLASG